jgi:hypothetical protein
MPRIKTPATKIAKATRNSGSDIFPKSGFASKLKTPLTMQTANTKSNQIDIVVAFPI